MYMVAQTETSLAQGAKEYAGTAEQSAFVQAFAEHNSPQIRLGM